MKRAEVQRLGIPLIRALSSATPEPSQRQLSPSGEGLVPCVPQKLGCSIDGEPLELALEQVV